MKVKKAAINIAPLSDVCFTILITLMVTVPILAMTGTLKVSLPAAFTVEDRREDAISVAISADHRIEIAWPANHAGTETTWEEYVDFLKDVIEENPNHPVLIRADEFVSHGLVLQVIQVAKTLGADDIAIATTQKAGI